MRTLALALLLAACASPLDPNPDGDWFLSIMAEPAPVDVRLQIEAGHIISISGGGEPQRSVRVPVQLRGDSLIVEYDIALGAHSFRGILDGNHWRGYVFYGAEPRYAFIATRP